MAPSWDRPPGLPHLDRELPDEPDPELLEAYYEGMLRNTAPRQYKTSNWGRSIAVNASIAPADAVVLAEVQSKTPRLWAVTATLAGVRPGSVLGDIPADSGDAFLTIEFGVGGNQGRAEVDVARGWTVNVFGDYVRVKLAYPNFIIGAPFGAPARMGAMVTPAQGGKQTTEVYRSVRYDTIDPAGGSQSRGIPFFATRVFYQADTGNATAPEVRMGFLSADGANVVQEWRLQRIQGGGYMPAYTTGFPIARDAQLLRLTNDSAAAIDSPTCVYRLSF